MKGSLLASAAIVGLLIGSPVLGANDRDHGSGSPPSAGSGASGHSDHGNASPHTSSNNSAGGHNNFNGRPAGNPAISNPSSGMMGGSARNRHRNTGTPAANTGTGASGTGVSGTNGWNGNRGGSWNGKHSNTFRNPQWNSMRRAYSATQRYHYGQYNRPSGWYYRRWNYGDFLPALFFAQSYWINNFDAFGLQYPPPGTVWVRYGNDALLIDEDTGQVIQVAYGIFY